MERNYSRKIAIACLTFLSISQLQGSIFGSDTVPRGTMVKTQDPPCDFSPSLEFMNESYEAYSLKNMTSAAWFARTVQLVDGQRNLAWERLAVQPLSIRDFTLKKFGLHATLLEFNDNVLMLYRGTEDVLDYILNGVFYTTEGRPHGLPGWVHEGFFINFRMTWPEVRVALKDAAARGKKIVFASHSLGGVMSQYAAWLLENEGISVSRIYAFQSPNPGDLEFKQKFEQRFSGRSSNTIYGEDVTPHIPPIVESAPAFGASLPRKLSKLAVKLLSKARYGTLSDRFVVAADGTRVQISQEKVIESEVNYWSSYLSKSGGKPFPLGLGPESPFVADHDIDKVLCSLAKNLN